MGKTQSHPFRKKWGQNFLVDPNIIKKIYQIINPKNSDNIIEIGPGEGALTQIIMPQVNDMISIEIDPLLVNYLNKLSELKNDPVWKPSKMSNLVTVNRKNIS